MFCFDAIPPRRQGSFAQVLCDQKRGELRMGVFSASEIFWAIKKTTFLYVMSWEISISGSHPPPIAESPVPLLRVFRNSGGT